MGSVQAFPRRGGVGTIADVWRLIGELGIERSVRIEGWVEGDAKERLLRHAWVAALPSHVEALPMAVLEALASGVPVVATNCEAKSPFAT